jgi:hypothetical protein
LIKYVINSNVGFADRPCVSVAPLGRGPYFSEILMPTKNQAVAASIIKFLASLHGLHEHSVDGRAAVVDLITGIGYVANLDYEDGEMLTMIAPGGSVIAEAVITHKVVQAYLVRCAEAMAIAGGGTAKVQFQQIRDHFDVKTGS